MMDKNVRGDLSLYTLSSYSMAVSITSLYFIVPPQAHRHIGVQPLTGKGKSPSALASRHPHLSRLQE
jgi:hypothetical protein